MSAGGSFGGNRGLRPVPPEKGVFPLDHMHLCDLEKKEYLNCLKTSGHQSEKCRHLSKKYLECRMEKLHSRCCVASPNSYHQMEFNGKARHGRARIREYESGQFVW